MRAMIITNMTSAFWHGFYPTYYVTFLFIFFVIDGATVVYRYRHIFDWVPSFAVPILVPFVGQTLFGYFLLLFVSLTHQNGWKLGVNYMFAPPIYG